MLEQAGFMQDRSLTVRSSAIHAAQYVRMSTEHQQYSIDNQSAVIMSYAQAHDMEVVRTYADAGKSGLTLNGRQGLRQLLDDVEGGNADFSTILVYDVSRWGRFLDADESAYYEYRCKRAKIEVHYCAEPFTNDGSISSALLKALKRTMAAEYSRELSKKVFAGKCRLIEQGFRQGGHAGYGLRRLLVDQSGVPKGQLNRGERKSIFTDRVILIPGPENEIRTVQEIYEQFIKRRRSPAAIARNLNGRGIVSEHGGRWTRAIVREILTNPKYVGTNLFNRRSYRLQRYMRNPPEMWLRVEGAFTPIIASDTFRDAQLTLEARCHHYNDEELLALLRTLLEREGRLSAPLIDQAWDMPSHAVYAIRFGGVLEAYHRIGYDPENDYSYFPTNERLLGFREEQVAALTDDLKGVGAAVERDSATGLITINDELAVGFTVVRCRHTKHRGCRWLLRLNSWPESNIIVAARMAPGNLSVLDYYILPNSRERLPPLDIGLDNDITIDCHRFSDLSVLHGLAKRTIVQEML